MATNAPLKDNLIIDRTFHFAVAILHLSQSLQDKTHLYYQTNYKDPALQDVIQHCLTEPKITTKIIATSKNKLTN
jgi:hypothetical protein